jgi:hypothetical protein
MLLLHAYACSYQIVRYISKLAQVKKLVVVMTIHQPSASVFHMMDDVLLLAAGGRMACVKKKKEKKEEEAKNLRGLDCQVDAQLSCGFPFFALSPSRTRLGISYNGPVGDAVFFFSSNGFVPPEGANPADFFLQVNSLKQTFKVYNSQFDLDLFFF